MSNAGVLPISRLVAAISAVVALSLGYPVFAGTPELSVGPSEGTGSPAPRFLVEPDWPKPLPNQWIMGQVAGIAVDRHDNIWIVQRPRSLDNAQAGATSAVTVNAVGTPIDALGFPRPFGPNSECCLPAPSVMKFDRAGNLLDAWGGPADPGFVGTGGRCDPADGCYWPAGEHGIFVDHNDYVYIAGNGNSPFPPAADPLLWAASHGRDAQVLKFTSDGTFVLNIGDPGFLGPNSPDSNDTGGASNGTPQPFAPADMEVDPETNILYIADGYGNRRVLAVDADTGTYIGHWGAYGQNPVDDTNPGPYANDRDAGILPPGFRTPVHCVRIVGELIYVCDRVNNRIQVFNKYEVGGACSNLQQAAGLCGFVKEEFIAADTLGNGTAWDLDTSADPFQSCLYMPDGTNQRVWLLERDSLGAVGHFGYGSHNAGGFRWVHNLAVDSRGNIYTAEVHEGKRAQKFRPRGPLICR